MPSTAPWPTSTVGDHFEIQLGKMLDSARNTGEPKFYLGNRAIRWGCIDLSSVGVVPLTPREQAKYILKRNDLLVCEGGEVGRAAIWKEELPECYYQKALHRLRPKSHFDPRVMLALLEYWSASNGYADYITQTSIAHLPRDRFLKMPLPAIPKGEQERLREIIDDFNELVIALEHLITKKRSIKQGMMQQLLTGKKRLVGFSEPWTEVRLSDAGATYGGLTGKSKEDFGCGSADFVTFMEVMSGARLRGRRLERVRLRPNERQNRVERGDVLFNGSSETPEEVALSAVVDFDPSPTTYLNSFCFGYRLKRRDLIDPTYLAYFFRSGSGRALVSSLAQGSTRYNIAKTQLLEVCPKLPPLSEQRAVVEVLMDAENGIASLESRLVKAKAIKQGMTQELLTGRTRLAPAEACS